MSAQPHTGSPLADEAAIQPLIEQLERVYRYVSISDQDARIESASAPWMALCGREADCAGRDLREGISKLPKPEQSVFMFAELRERGFLLGSPRRDHGSGGSAGFLRGERPPRGDGRGAIGLQPRDRTADARAGPPAGAALDPREQRQRRRRGGPRRLHRLCEPRLRAAHRDRARRDRGKPAGRPAQHGRRTSCDCSPLWAATRRWRSSSGSAR